MEFLLSENPLIQQKVRTKSISNMYNRLVDNATNFNIATGFITNDSVAALKQIVEFREGNLCLSLFIGMNYLEGFTKPQYFAVKELNDYLINNNVGRVFLSPQALYHGKMYSFMKGNMCLASFIGSSNLGSFVGTSQNLIEADLFLKDNDGLSINNYICQITKALERDFNDVNIEKFKEPEIELLKGYSYVKRLSNEELQTELKNVTGKYVDVPLKTEAKSNLNTYFGKGKIKGRYSPRGWYEVEIILSKNLPGIDLLPDKEQGSFTVITSDGYQFDCSRQGDYSKNFRSDYDLKILGRWIKGQMENAGALEVGTPVTDETLRRFGKSKLHFELLKSGKFLLSII